MNAPEDPRALLRKLAGEAYRAHAPLSWFEPLYRAAQGDAAKIPWADLQPHPLLLEWLSQASSRIAPQQRVLVVGCGLGDDAQAWEKTAASVSAFDLSSTAIDWARKRFPTSTVDYRSADLLQRSSLYPEWQGAFDWLYECYTLQAMPEDLRAQALARMPALLKNGGHLLLITRIRPATAPLQELPFPLALQELEPLAQAGMQPVQIETFEYQGDQHLRGCWQKRSP